VKLSRGALQAYGKRVSTYTHGCSSEHAKALFQLSTDKVPTHNRTADSSLLLGVLPTRVWGGAVSVRSTLFFPCVCGEVASFRALAYGLSVLPTRVWGGEEYLGFLFFPRVCVAVIGTHSKVWRRVVLPTRVWGGGPVAPTVLPTRVWGGASCTAKSCHYDTIQGMSRLKSVSVIRGSLGSGIDSCKSLCRRWQEKDPPSPGRLRCFGIEHTLGVGRNRKTHNISFPVSWTSGRYWAADTGRR